MRGKGEFDEFGYLRQRFDSVEDAIAAAEKVLGYSPVDQGPDPRWQAILQIGFFAESGPEAVWEFVRQHGGSDDEDLQRAIACVLLEHLLEHHFDVIFARVELEVAKSKHFADMFCGCWAFGQSEEPENKARFDALKRACGSVAFLGC